MATVARNSLIITQKGFIESFRVRKGDFVFCADGRFRKVEVAEKTKEIMYEIKGHGHPNLWVPEKQEILATNYKRGSEGRHFNPLSFLLPESMKGMFWASPRLFPEMKSDITPNEAWFAGLSMASGSAIFDNPILVIVHESKRGELERRLDEMKIKSFHTSLHLSYQYQVNAPKLAKWMKKTMEQTMGRRMVPLEVLCGKKDIQKAFFDGYMFGKGTEEVDRFRASADNKIEAVSIKVLSQTLGLSTGVYYSETIKDKEKREYWQLAFEKSARSSAEIGRNRFGLVRGVEKLKKERPGVIIQVEGNHSLIVDGIVFK